MTSENEIKVGDFGLSTMSLEYTSTKTHCGTLPNMAVEMQTNEEYDSRCDVFSLGCVLYEMAAKTSPFHGNESRMLKQKLTQEYRPIDKSYSKDIHLLIDSMLNLREKRPSINEVLKNNFIENHYMKMLATKKECPSIKVIYIFSSLIKRFLFK